jgi:hypothetical protein
MAQALKKRIKGVFSFMAYLKVIVDSCQINRREFLLFLEIIESVFYYYCSFELAINSGFIS